MTTNFLFIIVGLILLVISVQLSYEISRVEARSRRLAEDVALLAEKVNRLSAAPATPPGEPTSPNGETEQGNPKQSDG